MGENPSCLDKIKYSTVLTNLATLYYKQKSEDLEHALLLSERALKIRLEELPETDPLVQVSYELNAEINFKLGKLNQAYFDYEKAIKISKQLGSPSIKLILKNASIKKKL